jgi:hypothetical protein
MTKIAGSGAESGSIRKRHGSADPDPNPNQNVMDPEHCRIHYNFSVADPGSGAFLTPGSAIGFFRITNL